MKTGHQARQTADKEGKAWFFLLCGYQPKINKLIFHVFYLMQSVSSTVE
jgi:hypothetical protein